MQIASYDLGLVSYAHAWDFQRHILEKVYSGQINSALVACRHFPVITLGRQGHRTNILCPEPELKEKGVDVYTVERGGDVTYHGPGQLTLYPIFNLVHFKKDIHWYLRALEEAVIMSVADFGVQAERLAGLTGVWVNGSKIASIGIAVRQWVTFHGVSINVKENDLANFSFIRACGMDITMTSLETQLRRNVEMSGIKEKLFLAMQDVFRFGLDNVSLRAPIAQKAHTCPSFWAR